jgi:hypothetical protein
VDNRVLARFGLGWPVSPPERVGGGLSNELWRVRVRSGAYAVKRMVVNADGPGFVGKVEAAFEVERRAFAAGVPMPEPVPELSSGRALAAVGSSLYRVHRWVDGRAGVGSADGAVALVAAIHAVGRARWERPSPPWCADGWGAQVAGLAGRVAEQPDRVLVVDGHRDLDRKNTLLTGDGVLMALDWDAAGPVGAVQEAVAVALDWTDGSPAAFAGAVAAYPCAVPAEPWIFAGWVAAQGGWRDYTAARDPGQAGVTLGRLRRLATGIDDLLAALPRR